MTTSSKSQSHAYSHKHLTNVYVGLLGVGYLGWAWLASSGSGVSHSPYEITDYLEHISLWQ